MSEKRFDFSLGACKIYDKQEEKLLEDTEVCGLLNEQQATISHLEKVNGKNFAKRRLLEQDNLVLQNENEQLRQQLQEYKENWDDMVELATKTSLRNVELDEQIGRLQREN